MLLFNRLAWKKQPQCSKLMICNSCSKVQSRLKSLTLVFCIILLNWSQCKCFQFRQSSCKNFTELLQNCKITICKITLILCKLQTQKPCRARCKAFWWKFTWKKASHRLFSSDTNTLFLFGSADRSLVQMESVGHPLNNSTHEGVTVACGVMHSQQHSTASSCVLWRGWNWCHFFKSRSERKRSNECRHLIHITCASLSVGSGCTHLRQSRILQNFAWLTGTMTSFFPSVVSGATPTPVEGSWASWTRDGRGETRNNDDKTSLPESLQLQVMLVLKHGAQKPLWSQLARTHEGQLIRLICH